MNDDFQRRKLAIQRLSRFLTARGFPKLQFAALFAMTGAAGVLFSYLLLRAGLTHMGARYAIAAFLAYGVFLGLLKVWRDRQLAFLLRDQGLALQEKPDPPDAAAGTENTSPGWLDIAWAPLDICFCNALVLSLSITAIIIGALVLWLVPALLAEVLLDGLLVSGLARRLQKTGEDLQGRSFLQTAVRTTWMPALWAVVLLALGGTILSQAFPWAHTIGDLMRPRGR